MGMPSILSLASGTVVFVTTILFTVGFATPNWRVKTNGNENFGLWQECFDKRFDIQSGSFLTGCTSNREDHTDWLDATRALVTIGLLCLLLGLMASLIACCAVEGAVHIMAYVQMGMEYAAAIFTAIGLIVYGAQFDRQNQPEYALGYSFALTVVGCIGSLTSAGLTTIDVVRTKE